MNMRKVFLEYMYSLSQHTSAKSLVHLQISVGVYIVDVIITSPSPTPTLKLSHSLAKEKTAWHRNSMRWVSSPDDTCVGCKCRWVRASGEVQLFTSELVRRYWFVSLPPSAFSLFHPGEEFSQQSTNTGRVLPLAHVTRKHVLGSE